MEKTYVIVHPQAVEKEAKFISFNTTTAKKETQRQEKAENIIRKVKSLKKEAIPIFEVIGLPNEIPKNLPPPNKDHTICVGGAYKENCCRLQLESLLNSGYTAQIDEEITL